MNRFFSFKLYVEGLKKVRVLGVMCAILSALLSSLPPLTQLLVHLANGADYSGRDVSIDSSQVFLPLIVICLFAPVTVISMFSYLNRRNESDFYHSLSISRKSVFLSFFSACVTWIWGAILLSFAVSALLWRFHPDYADMMSELMPMILSFFTSSLMLMGFAAVASSMTGTLLSCVAAFVLVTAAPIALSTFLHLTVYSLIPTFTGFGGVFSFLRIESMSPLGWLAAQFFWSYDTFPDAWCFVFSLLFGIAAAAIACTIYTKRLSEWAARPVGNTKHRDVLRFLAAFPFAMTATHYALTSALSGYENEFMFLGNIGGAFTFAVVTVFVWFVAELALSRKFRYLLRCAVQFPVLAVVCAVFAVSMLCLRGWVLNFKPAADQVESVYTDFCLKNCLYELRSVEEIGTSDSTIIATVCDSIDHTADIIREHRYEASYHTTAVTLKLKNGRTVTRELVLNDITEGDLLLMYIDADKAFEDRFFVFPDEIGENISVYNWAGISNDYDFDANPDLAIWESFCAEFAAAPIDEKLEAKRMAISSGGRLYPEIGVDALADGEYFGTSFVIPPSFTATRQLRLDYLHSRNTNDVMSFIKYVADHYADPGMVYYYPDFRSFGIAVTSSGKDLLNGRIDADSDSGEESILATFSAILSDTSVKNDIDASAHYIVLDCDYTVGYSTEYVSGFVSVSEETAQKVAELLGDNLE